MPDMKRSLTIDEVPDVHKEPYVLTGYRPPQQPWRFYLMSIFSQHNETVNVWTHLLPCFYVLWLLKTYSGENYTKYLTLFCCEFRRSILRETENQKVITVKCREQKRVYSLFCHYKLVESLFFMY